MQVQSFNDSYGFPCYRIWTHSVSTSSSKNIPDDKTTKTLSINITCHSQASSVCCWCSSLDASLYKWLHFLSVRKWLLMLDNTFGRLALVKVHRHSQIANTWKKICYSDWIHNFLLQNISSDCDAFMGCMSCTLSNW